MSQDSNLKSIQGKQLKELQSCELEILKDFIEVCKKLNLTWYMCGGSCLGTIRHEGFIPWDDDIDVCMPRKDYDIFCKKAQPLLKKNYFLQTYKTDPEYSMGYAKIRASNTTFIESSCKTHNINHGVFIDIFQLDNYCPNRKCLNFKNKFFMDLIRLLISRTYSYPIVVEKTTKYKIHEKVALVFYKNKTIQELNQEADKIAKSHKNNGTFYKVFHGPGDRDIYYRKDLFGSPQTKLFAGIKVNVPEKYDEYLTRFYGDYMQLPPKEKRIAHHFVDKIDFNKPYTYYINTK